MRTIKMILNTAAMKASHTEAVRASLSVNARRLSKAEQSMAFKFGVGAELQLIGKLIRSV